MSVLEIIGEWLLVMLVFGWLVYRVPSVEDVDDRWPTFGTEGRTAVA